MRLERLILDSGEHRFATDFHPRLTVIGGLDAAARAALSDEVIASLGGARAGTHLEVDHDGRHLTLFRPIGGRHRVVDTDAVRDVTDEFVATDGTIDLFAAAGVDRSIGRDTIRLTHDDLVERTAGDETVAALASVDQEELWEAAMSLRAANELVERVSAGTGASATDAMLLDSVEERHASLVAVTQSYERTRLISLVIGAVGVMAGLGHAVLARLAETDTSLAPVDLTRTALPMLALSLVGLLLSLRYRSKVQDATAAEREALTMVNSGDYPSFHLERVGALLDDDGERRTFMEAVTGHRAAQRRWEAIAGDVRLAFALDHQSLIRATSDLHGGMGALQVFAEHVPIVADDVMADMAQAIIGRIDAVRALRPGQSPFPLVVDDPFSHLDRTVKPLLLEMLAASANDVQIVVLTCDSDVTEWARTESLAGTVAVVEPLLTAVGAPSRPGDPATMSPHA